LARQNRAIYELLMLPDLRRREKDAQVRREEIRPFLDVAHAAKRLMKTSNEQQRLINGMISAAAEATRKEQIDSHMIEQSTNVSTLIVSRHPAHELPAPDDREKAKDNPTAYLDITHTLVRQIESEK
jgi:hypothetical protein